MSVLQRIVAETREDVAQRRRATPLEAVPRQGERPFAAALRRPGLSVIAEHKRRSPSAGVIRESATVSDVVTAYERGGAAALSVLTEPRHFHGSLADLREARAATALPILRKDFVVDPYQLHEAVAAGADAVLLIVAALEPALLAELHAAAGELGLDVLVEVHTPAELEAALQVGPEILGVNNRDLADFSVDVRRTLALLPEIPPGTTVVAESGIASREQADELEAAGVAAVLVGELLMRAPDPAQRLRDLLPRRAQ